MKKSLFKTGVCGAVIAGVCCFTPILVTILTALGLSALVGWLDYVLMPAFFAFIALIGYSLYQREQREN